MALPLLDFTRFRTASPAALTDRLARRREGGGGKVTLPQLLGLGDPAAPREVRRRYLAVARKLHPDKCPVPQTTALFASVQALYAQWS